MLGRKQLYKDKKRNSNKISQEMKKSGRKFARDCLPNRRDVSHYPFVSLVTVNPHQNNSPGFYFLDKVFYRQLRFLQMMNAPDEKGNKKPCPSSKPRGNCFDVGL